MYVELKERGRCNLLFLAKSRGTNPLDLVSGACPLLMYGMEEREVGPRPFLIWLETLFWGTTLGAPTT